MANSIDREAIYAALFALVSGDSAWKTKSRLLKMWDEVDAALQPAIFLTQGNEVADTQRTGIPIVWNFRAKIYMYANVGQQGDSGFAPSQILNPLIDKVCDLLQPPLSSLGYEQTLGGLVTRCRIEGEVATDEGLLGEQGVVILPVLIVVAGNA